MSQKNGSKPVISDFVLAFTVSLKDNMLAELITTLPRDVFVFAIEVHVSYHWLLVYASPSISLLNYDLPCCRTK